MKLKRFNVKLSERTLLRHTVIRETVNKKSLKIKIEKKNDCTKSVQNSPSGKEINFADLCSTLRFTKNG